MRRFIERRVVSKFEPPIGFRTREPGPQHRDANAEYHNIKEKVVEVVLMISLKHLSVKSMQNIIKYVFYLKMLIL